jgi:DNA-binding CsgD family transcriptional regulator
LRDPEKGAFTPGHAALLTRLMPHLHRAVRLLTPARPVWRDDLAKVGEDASTFGVLAIDGARRLLHCNRSGEALLAAGEVLCRSSGLLACVDDAQNQRLGTALDAIARTGQPANLLLTHPARPDARFSMSLTPLLPEDGALQHTTGVLCLVVALDHRRIATAHQLMQLFGLSAAEARLARALAAGDTLEGYAGECALKMSTVKSQLHSVFEKTRADRQSALVRLIAGIPPVREPRQTQN